MRVSSLDSYAIGKHIYSSKTIRPALWAGASHWLWLCQHWVTVYFDINLLLRHGIFTALWKAEKEEKKT